MLRKNRLFKMLDRCLVLLLFPLYLYYRLFPKKPRIPTVPRKILIAKLCCFGDSLLALISVQSLKKKYPEAQITLLASERNAGIFGQFF